jgi:hypothetical protein
MTQNQMNGKSSKNQVATDLEQADALRTAHTRSPQEALGLSSGNSLLVASLISAAITAVVLAAGPYFYEQQYPKVKAAKPAQTESMAESGATTQPPPSTGPDKTKAAPADPKGTGKPVAKKDIPGVLGETGVKKGVPVNPLDKKDDLLDDLNKK